MNIPGRIGLIAAIGLMAGCAAAPRVVDAGFRKANLEGRQLRIMPIHSLEIHNQDDFRDDFGEDAAKGPGVVLSDLFGEAVFSLVDRAEALFDDVPMPDSVFQDTVLTVPGKKAAMEWSFRFPSDSALRRRNIEPDLVLQIFDVQVHRNWRPGGGAGGHMEPAPSGVGRVPGGAGSPPTFLYLSGKYILWDYRAGAPVAYGATEGLSQYHLGMSRENWENAIAQAAYDLLNGTPVMSGKARPLPGRARKPGR